MVLCFIPGCSHRTCRELCSFHRFPRDPKEAQQWEKLCRRADRRATAYDRICSCHFDGVHKRPSIFPWTKGASFVDPKRVERKIKSTKRKLEEAAGSAEQEEEAPSSAGQEEAATMQRVMTPTPPPDHQYSLTIDKCEAMIGEKNKEIKALKENVEQLEARLRLTEQRQASEQFSIEKIKNDEKKMLLYTTLPYDVFSVIHRCLSRFELNYYKGFKVTSISQEDQLLMTLMKLKLNTPDLDLGQRFCVSETTVSNVFYTYLYALHECFFEGMMEGNIPSQMKCKGSMPNAFNDFQAARIVMDATEITMDIPHRLDQKAQTYSQYKSRHTVKAVMCVAPNGVVVHVSDLYPGSTSDTKIVEKCGILKHLKPGDLILADKGFTIQKMLPPGVHLNIPPFLAAKSQFSPQEAKLSYKIAKARIHVERANERIKNFAILNHIPAYYRHIASKIFQVCAVLINFQAPLLEEIAEQYSFESE